MANWWEAAPLAEQAPAAPGASGNWWDAAPVVSQTGTARVEPSTGVDVARGAATGAIEGSAGLLGLPGTVKDAATYGMGWLLDQTAGRVANRVTQGNWDATTGGRAAASAVNALNPTSGAALQTGAEMVTGPLPQPETLPGQFARTIARNVPGAATGPGGVAAKAALAVVPGVAEEAAGQAARRILPAAEPYVRAGTGLATGLGTIAATQALQRGAAQRAVERAAPSTEALEQAGHAAYQRAEQAGVQFAAPAYRRAVEDARDAVAKAGIDTALHPKAMAALRRLEDAVGSAPTLEEIGTLRRIVGSAVGSMDRDEARIGKILQSQLDNFVNRARPQDVVAGDVRAATQALTEARANWAAMRRSQAVEAARDTAETRAGSTGIGGNADNAARQNIRRLMENPRQNAGFSQQELDLMRDIVMGTPSQNALRMAGRMAPTSGIVGTGIGTGLGASIGGAIAGPAGAAAGAAVAPAIGQAAKMSADRITQRNIDLLSAIVRSRPSGQTPELMGLLQSLDPVQANAARLLLLERSLDAPQTVNQPR